MSSAIFIATLAVVGSFFSSLLAFLVLPQSASRRSKGAASGNFAGKSQHQPSKIVTLSPEINRPELELSKQERLFHDVLVKTVGGMAVVFAKVPVANVLAPAQGGQSWQGLFNKVSDMHFDFVVCAADGSAAKFAIQLEDPSNRSSSQQKRDQLLSSACESAGLPLIRIRAARGYAVGFVRERLAAALEASMVSSST